MTPRPQLVVPCALALLALSGCGAGADQTEVRVEVTVPSSVTVEGLEARLTWLGQRRTVALSRQGDLWTGRASGRLLRFLPITLRARTGAAHAVEIYAGLEPLSPGAQTLTYAVEPTTPPSARRLATGGTADGVQRREAMVVAASLAWAALALLLVHWLRRRVVRPGGREPWPMPDGAVASLVVWVALAVAWTWPALLSGPQLVAGRHFDVLGVLWFLEHTSSFFQDHVDTYISYPLGVRYENFDSYTLVLLARLASWLDPARLHGWLQVLGVATSGWAADRFARALGARAPWTLLAGLTYACSGLAATALLEGHVYFVLNPWLPLFAWAWWRALGEGGRAVHGVCAGLAFVAVLFTSAYLAVAGAVLAVGFFVAGAWRRRAAVLVPALGALAVVLPASVFYLTVILGNIGSTGTRANPEAIPLMSASLSRLAAATPELDRASHSMALGLSGIMLALVCAAPLLLPARGRWRALAWTGAAALLLSMGPVLVAGKEPTGLPLPYALLMELPVGDFLRFPIRLAWGALLCGGVLAALAGTSLERASGGAARVLVLLAVVEVFLLTSRMPMRQAALSTASPGAYRQVDGPVLDLLPQGLSTADDLDYWFWATACHQQTRHHRPLAEDCISTRITESPRHVLGAWLTARLLSGEAAGALGRLRQMGFAGVAFYPDLFHPGDRARLARGLALLDRRPVTTTDGGALVMLHRIPGGGKAARPAAAYKALGKAAASAVGQGPAIARVKSLRVALLGEERIPEVSYLARLTAPGKAAASLQLHNNVEPGSAPLDTVWQGLHSGPLPGALKLSLVRRTPDGEAVLWSGPVRLLVPHERLVFRLAERAPGQQPSRAWPVAAVPSAPSRPADAHNGITAAVGWGAYAALALTLGLLAWVRRRRAGNAN